MGFSKPPGVPCPPHNPHCHGEAISASIQSDFLTILIVVGILVYMLIIFKKRNNQ